MRKLFRQFSFPGGIPSHVAPETPGSIHEGGELGYALVHAYGAAFDNPDLLVCCVVGDGEAETGPLAASWHSNKFVDPARDGAVLPILHLNGYKIANPTVLARIPEDELRSLSRATGTRRTSSPATSRRRCTRRSPRSSTARSTRSRRSSAARRAGGARAPALADDRAAHPEGLDRPEGGRRQAGRGDVALTPGAARRARARTPSTCASSRSGCAPTGPRSCSTSTGRPRDDELAAAPAGERRMGANPHTNGGTLLRDLRLPDFRDYAVDVPAPAQTSSEAMRVLGGFLRDVMRLNEDAANFRVFGPDETASNRLGAVLEATDRAWMADDRAGRRPPRARRPGDGGPERAPLPGLARGVPADRPSRRLQLLRGVHPHRRLDVQPAREVAEGDARRSRGGGRSPR